MDIDNIDQKIDEAESALEQTREVRKICAAALLLAANDDERHHCHSALTFAQKDEADRANAIKALRSGVDPMQAAREDVSEKTKAYNLATHALHHGASTREEAERLWKEIGISQLIAIGAERALERAQQGATSALSTATSARLRQLWEKGGALTRSLRFIFGNRGTLGEAIELGERNRGDAACFAVVRALVEGTKDIEQIEPRWDRGSAKPTRAEIDAERAQNSKEWRLLVATFAGALVPRVDMKAHRANMGMSDADAAAYRGQYAREAQQEAARRARPARTS